MSEINMEQMPSIAKHNVSTVSITDPQYERGNTVTSTRPEEIVWSDVEGSLIRICGFYVVPYTLNVKCSECTCLFMDLGRCFGVYDNLNHSNLILCGDDLVWFHSEIHPIIKPIK